MPGEGRPGAPARILLVEDDPALADLLGQLLAGEGYAVAVCMSGEEAVRAAPDLGPDLILLDVRLPGLDGPAVLDRLATDPRTRAVPVVVWTAAAAPEAAAWRARLGGRAAAFLAKPFGVEELLARVRALLGVPGPGAR